MMSGETAIRRAAHDPALAVAVVEQLSCLAVGRRCEQRRAVLLEGRVGHEALGVHGRTARGTGS